MSYSTDPVFASSPEPSPIEPVDTIAVPILPSIASGNGLLLAFD